MLLRKMGHDVILAEDSEKGKRLAKTGLVFMAFRVLWLDCCSGERDLTWAGCECKTILPREQPPSSLIVWQSNRVLEKKQVSWLIRLVMPWLLLENQTFL